MTALRMRSKYLFHPSSKNDRQWISRSIRYPNLDARTATSNPKSTFPPNKPVYACDVRNNSKLIPQPILHDIYTRPGELKLSLS